MPTKLFGNFSVSILCHLLRQPEISGVLECGQPVFELTVRNDGYWELTTTLRWGSVRWVRMARLSGQGFHSRPTPKPSSTNRRNARTAAHDLWAQDSGSEAMRALLTTLPCHLASGRSQAWCTISRKMGVVAEMVIAPANDRQEIAATSVNAVLCCKGGTFMSSGVSGQEIVPGLVESGGSRLRARYATCSC
jgi:hypothetical protein